MCVRLCVDRCAFCSGCVRPGRTCRLCWRTPLCPVDSWTCNLTKSRYAPLSHSPSLPLSPTLPLCFPHILGSHSRSVTGAQGVPKHTLCPPLVSTRPLLAHPWVTIACVRHRLDPRTSPAACCKWTTWSQQWRQRPWRHSRCGSCTILVLSCLWKMQPYCCAVPLKCLTLRSVPHGAGAVSLAGRYGGLCV
jgi:hypothetical protein